MPFTLPEIQVGDPMRYDGLAVFPLFTEGGGDVPYTLSEDAMQGKLVTVTEVSQSGSVPELRVENRGDTRVLFLEGEELIGAKQNRVLNLSILIAARSKTPVPVSCVEQGRWGYRTKEFGSGSASSSKLRRILKSSVSDSLKAKRGHRSDQAKVWREVYRQQQSLGVCSASKAMSDTVNAFQDRIRQFQEKLRPAEGAVGIEIAMGGKIVCLDLLDKPTTCQRIWDRLLAGHILDALEVTGDEELVGREDIEAIVANLSDLGWEQVETVGEGQEYRAGAEDGLMASALTFEENLIHGSVSWSA